MKWHAIYKEDGRVKECEFEAPADFAAADAAFTVEHPNATYWELGMPIVEVEYDDSVLHTHTSRRGPVR